jgi:hypothetical protein
MALKEVRHRLPSHANSVLTIDRHSITRKPVENHTMVANQGWRRRFATIVRLPSEITCLLSLAAGSEDKASSSANLLQIEMSGNP